MLKSRFTLTFYCKWSREQHNFVNRQNLSDIKCFNQSDFHQKSIFQAASCSSPVTQAVLKWTAQVCSRLTAACVGFRFAGNVVCHVTPQYQINIAAGLSLQRQYRYLLSSLPGQCISHPTQGPRGSADDSTGQTLDKITWKPPPIHTI